MPKNINTFYSALFGTSHTHTHTHTHTLGGKHKSWCKRWFILTDNCLYYFKSPKVSVAMVTCKSVDVISLVNLSLSISIYTNVNDNYPQFAAPAYFGEVYAGAPDNYRVHHIVLRVSDSDDPYNMQQISFQISIPPITGTEITGYNLQVSDREPYYVVAVSIPDSAQSQLLEFMIEVTDEGGLSSSVPLYLSIFTAENLICFILDGVDIQDFLSCTNRRTSLCEFRVAVTEFIGGLPSINGLVSFYNDSVQVSPEDTQTYVCVTIVFA